MADRLIATPSQTVGPFFHIGLGRPDWADLTAGNPQGERIVVAGRVIDGDGAPVPDACLELWQANAVGRYAHPDDTRTDTPLDPNFRGFGRVSTNADGNFRFTTIRPGPVPGRGNSLQAPHIAVALFARGLLKQLYTRVYFAGEPLNETDPVLSTIADPMRRQTLIATRSEDADSAIWRLDIVMQGDNETVFFDI
ncbi:MAG: protocatechuate 3,4-dioxygenase subunit alpha [Alphaproteobacteria bacterium]|nr:protocatechuate 3,4-dioxygenase subunit alpha [Alphaproteobacteria bacterium]